MSRTRIKQKGPKAPRFSLRDMSQDELRAIIERAKTGPLSTEDCATLTMAVDTLLFLTQELEAKGTTIDRLRRMIFGASTERTRTIFGDGQPPPATGTGAPGEAGSSGPAAASDTPASTGPAKEKTKAPGHGRNGAAAYVGAEPIKVPHESLHTGDPCPACQQGKVYPMAQPAVLLRVRAMAPLRAFRYEKDRFRCNACGEVFTAASPEGVGPDKYDETATSMIGLLRYGTGVPFNRVARLEKGFGIPLPPPTQWELVKRAADLMAPALDELVRQGAQGTLLHNDDTKVKVLDLLLESRREADQADEVGKEDEPEDDDEADKPAGERTGMFTSGIVSIADGRPIALFFTGRQHAGENLRDVLLRRAAELPPPIQMCDALAANTAGDLKTVVAGCNAHGRRQFVEVAHNFPEECRFVLDQIGAVYRNDAITRQQEMSDDDRLRFHQEHSRKLMDDLKAWMEQQFAEHKVEPNSGLGRAIKYMLKHWSKLTLFLEKPGAPIDNSIAERALKMAIRHRRNSLFYKTLNGAHVGDMFMSFIHTCELNGANPFEYLVALQRYYDKVAERPADWMPWNYREALARVTTGPDPPG
jgi:transposase